MRLTAGQAQPVLPCPSATVQEHMMDASSIKVHIVEALVQLLKSPRLKQLDLTRGGGPWQMGSPSWLKQTAW